MEKTSNNGEKIILMPVIERFAYAKPFRGDDAREICNAVAQRVSRDFKDALKFSAYFKFNEETGEINGSNLYYCILINDELRKAGLHLPSVQIGKMLDTKKKLTNGVYRDYGVAVYDMQNPNSDLAKKLIAEANERGWKTPILAPFSALRIPRSSKVSVSFSDDTMGLLTGKEAQEYIQKNFIYMESSGVQGLARSRYGYWLAYWGLLADSDEDGRVDWVCGEATRAELEAKIADDIEKEHKRQLDNFVSNLNKRKNRALEILRGK